MKQSITTTQTQSSLYFEISQEVIYNHFLTNFNIGTFINLARTCKANHEEFIVKYKNIFDRDSFSPSEIASNPLHETFKFMEGCRRLYIEKALFKKNRWLFADNYTPSVFISYKKKPNLLSVPLIALITRNQELEIHHIQYQIDQLINKIKKEKSPQYNIIRNKKLLILNTCISSLKQIILFYASMGLIQIFSTSYPIKLLSAILFNTGYSYIILTHHLCLDSKKLPKDTFLFTQLVANNILSLCLIELTLSTSSTRYILSNKYNLLIISTLISLCGNIATSLVSQFTYSNTENLCKDICKRAIMSVIIAIILVFIYSVISLFRNS